jgi:hypothetical protein
MKSDILLTLIKEVVKNEVKQQVKEEIAKMIKSGAVTLNSQKKKTPSLAELTEVSQNVIPVKKSNVFAKHTTQQQREYSKDPMINEILNMTQPFTAKERAEGSMGDIGGGGSILDAIQPQRTMEEDWETLDYANVNVPQQALPTTDNAGADAVIKALTRDYSALTKVFAEQEKLKKGR